MLELKDVRLTTGSDRLTEPLSLTLSDGCCCCVGGADGAALTLLCNTIVGLTAPTAGYVSVDGEPVTRLSAPTFRLDMGYVPRDIRMPAMTVGDLVEQLRRLRPNRKTDAGAERITAEWALLGLEASLMEKDMRTLTDSTGHRLLLSMAAVFRRPCLIADQPTLYMDDEAARQTWRYVRHLNDEGTAVLLTTRLDDPIFNQPENEHFFFRRLAGAAAPADTRLPDTAL